MGKWYKNPMYQNKILLVSKRSSASHLNYGLSAIGKRKQYIYSPCRQGKIVKKYIDCKYHTL